MLLALTSVLALSLGAAPARPDELEPAAEPVRDDEASAVNLVWDAPADECADAATMQARLDEAMELALEDDSAARQRWVIARVRKVEDGWALRLWVAPEGGLSERALTESSCAELERATLTIVAMLMPPVVHATDPVPPPEPGDLQPPPRADGLYDDGELQALIGDAPEADTPPPDPGGPDMAPPPPSEIQGAIGFEGGYSTGAMPSGAGGFAISGAMLVPSGRIVLVGSYWSTRNIGLDTAPGARGRYTSLLLGLRGCAAPRVGERVEIPACGGIEGGSVIANVDGAALLHGPGQAVVLLNVHSGVHVLLVPTVALKLGAQGWVALRQAEHRVLGSTLSRSNRFGYRLWGGVEFRFGGRRRARAFER